MKKIFTSQFFNLTLTKRTKVFIVIFIVFYVLFGAFLTVRQERFIYFPTPQDFTSCAGFRDAEKINYKNTRMYFKDNGPGIVVLYHGNYGSACDRSFYAKMFELAGYSYLVPEYAGFSNDKKPSSHKRIKSDVENVVSFLQAKNFSRVLLVGESIGVGFASYHSFLSEPDGILFLSPFTNLIDVARVHYWYYPVSFLVKNPFNNIELLKDYSNKIYIIHGGKDEVIPLELGQALFDSLTTKDKKMIVVPEYGHNNLLLSKEVEDVFDEFLSKP